MAAIHLTDEQFRDEIIDGKRLALVDFWADWCNPCKAMGPIIDQLADELDGQALVGKVDIMEYRELTESYGVESIPTVIAFRGGKEIARLNGMMPGVKDELKKLIQ